ncbi:MerR family transcriptional regulator [Crocinitomix sp.]|nr:MerR family transcriptional regulator [Crocinitomix sp.]
MSVYSIKDLENFTQIKAHTLRIWEQRYNLLSPERTDTNIRFYTDEDLKKILNINLLYTNGLKISKIANLSETEIQTLASDILLNAGGEDTSVSLNSIIGYVIDFDEASIVRSFDEQLSKFHLEEMFSNFLIPLLTKIGELWQVDAINIAHEHFLSNIIRRFLIVNTPQFNDEKGSKGTVLFFLRENEYHELALLFYNYHMRINGYKTIYIGQSTPDETLQSMGESVKPDIVFTSLVAKLDKNEFLSFMGNMKSAFKSAQIYVGGFQLEVHKKLVPDFVKVVNSVDEIDFSL